ncbi:DUF1631 domain-containing protein [Spongiibacter taiwanensis]|uniref:DUF1631 domain-containing protein n=1 Tax=Spongiibacter taiwanensis TaxID=1748242 RepID=UPI00203509F3|nr:DUF1631 domain-containing protein [Spongiibacter taiwanensis]USA44251.1 DUF1631 domain-containing protein [Spongiibacter taiwanensis]
MSENPKVVSLHGNRQSGVGQDAALPAAIEALRHKCQAVLVGQFAQALDELDDNLFELADEASTAKEQQTFFEAMHELRVRRQEMEARFEEHLLGAYQRMLNAAPQSATERGEAKLKVLESDALEELVALEGMSKKAERRFLKEVWVLCTAWQHCVGGEVPSARDLPMGPASISRALSIALEGVKFDIKPKLVLLKLFERRVMEGFGDMVAQLTPILEAHGLPSDATPPVAKAKPSAAPRRPAQGGDAGAEQHNEAATHPADDLSSEANHLANRLFDTLEQLLGGEGHSGRSEGSVLSKPSLMVALQDMQNEQYAQLNLGGVRGGNNGGANPDLVQHLIGRLQQVNRVSPADASALSVQRDRDTIQFVGTLFQYILEGDGLSDDLKAVIARLQIPILKMAMLDKNFFSHDEHPARKLLSGLLSASIGWEPTGALEKDPLYKKVDEIVMRVLRDFGVDTQIFVDAYEEFLSFSERDRRRAELMAKRAVDAADGRAVAEQARGYISAYLDQKLSQGRYPPVVANILKEGWSKVLFLSFVQHGRDSEALASDLKIAERLLWSVDVVTTPEHRAELIDALPGLVESLRDGFNRASLSAFETSQWFEQLERLHLAKLARPTEPVRADEVPPSSEQTELSALDEGLAVGLGEVQSPPVAIDDADEADAADAADVAVAVNENTDEEVPAPTETEPTAPVSAAADEEVQGKIAALRVGNWVDFRQSDGKMLRCRLAAVINGIGKYIFVNRAGIKVAEFDKANLAEAISQQRLFVIEDGRLFDRALESVISNLRDMKDKPHH